MTDESPALRFVPAPDNPAPVPPPPPPADQGRRDPGAPEAFTGRMRWLERVVREQAWARLTGTQRSVLAVLLVHANVDRGFECWPSIATIESMAGSSRSSVIRALQALVDARLIERVNDGGGRASTRYRLLRSGWESPDHFTHHPPNDTPAVSLVTPQQCHPRHPSSVTGDTPAVSPVTPERSEGTVERNVDDDAGEVRAPEAEPPPTDGSLFDAVAAVQLLVDRAFEPRDARKLVDEHGVQRVVQGVAHADFLLAKGELRKSYRAACVHAIKDGYVDGRVIEQQRNADRAARARARKQQRDAEQAKQEQQQAVRAREAEARLAALCDQARTQLQHDICAGLRAKTGNDLIKADGSIVRAAMLKRLMEEDA